MEKSTQENSTDKKKWSAEIVPANLGACGWYRLVQQAQMLQDCGKEVFIMPPGRYAPMRQNVVWTQRICTEKLATMMIDFKNKSGCQMIMDFDDLIWDHHGDTIPEYNWTRDKMDLIGNTRALDAHLDTMCEQVTVSTPVLKKLLSEFTDESKIHVLPNMLTYREWGFEERTSYPRHLSFMFAGSETHFNNDKKMYGDFTEPLARYLSKRTVITKHIAPWFLNPSVQYKASPLSRYARDFYRQATDAKFIVAPLTESLFNKAKSDLKYLESCAIGRVCLCSSFEDGPYEGAHPYQKIPVDATEQHIEFIVDRAEKNYDEILDWQYKYLAGRWLDDHIKDVGDVLGF